MVIEWQILFNFPSSSCHHVLYLISRSLQIIFLLALCYNKVCSTLYAKLDFSPCNSAHQKFKALAPEKVGHNRNAKLPMSKILQYPELRVNPFGDRICKVFSSSQDGDCTFEDFLDMMSVFSDAAPKAVKAEHAFRIFGKRANISNSIFNRCTKCIFFNLFLFITYLFSQDFDGDDMLGVGDLRQVVDRLTAPQRLNDNDMQQLLQYILDEADLDDDGALSFAEFEHIIEKSSDFSR